MGDLRKIAKEVRKDRDLAMELWSTAEVFPMLLAILIMDNKQLDAKIADDLLEQIRQHGHEERLQLTDWLMANQLVKNKKVLLDIESWENHAQPLQRRIFWYYQGRLR